MLEREKAAVPPDEQKGETVVQGLTPPSARRPESFDFLAPPRDADTLGWLGHYRVVKLLGAGGMGLVFLAEDTQLHRPVALKVVRPELAMDTSLRQRFVREARAMAAVKSDYIVTVHQVDEAGAVPFLAMEYLDGESLEQWLAQGNRPDVATVLRLGREIALGLAAAHERGLVHRDIKPANVFLETRSGRVKILDFGLARPAHEDSGITQAGLVLGTPDYMAPEQADGSAVTACSDLFSLGCLLYRLLADKKPFVGGSTLAILKAAALKEPPPLHQVNRAVPQRLAALVSSLLAKNPADRPASAQEVADILAAIAQQPTATRAVQSTAGGGRRSWRPAAAAIALVGLAIAAVCFGAYFLGSPAPAIFGNATAPSATTQPSTANAASTTPASRPAKELGTVDVTASGHTLNGGGSTFVYPLIEKWGVVYKKDKGVKVNYVATGSGAGIQQLTALAIDFCCSDAPLTPAQRKLVSEAGGDVMYVPLALGGIVPAYNLEGIDKPLRFSGPVLADIFRGDIRKWNNPALKELNPGVALPDLEISVLHRADNSGSTYIFTEFLSKVSKDWQSKVGIGFSVKWPVGTPARGNEGMLEAVAARPGTIAYLELLYALRGKVRFGAVKNKAGNYLLGSLETVTAAAEALPADVLQDPLLSLTYGPGKEAYPICGCTWAVIYVKQPSGAGQRLVDFLRWAIQDGQEYNTDLYYARLPGALAERAAQQLMTVQIGDK